MARPNSTQYRAKSSVKPTEREGRAYRVEQADRILLERVANVRTTLVEPRIGKRSSAAPYAPRSSSLVIYTSNTTKGYASTTSSYSASMLQISTQYQPIRRQARRQQFRPLGGVLNISYSSPAHLHESTSYLDRLERKAQHKSRKEAESEVMLQENQQRREEWAGWRRRLHRSEAVSKTGDNVSTAAANNTMQSSAIVEYDQQLPAESKRLSSIGFTPQEIHDTQARPNEQVVAQEVDHIRESEAQQAEQVETGHVGSKNEGVTQYSPLSLSLKPKKAKEQIIVGSTLAATFPAVSRQVFQRALYTDGTRAWIKVQVQGNGMVEAKALGALPQVRKRSSLVEGELEESRKRRLTVNYAFQIVETHKFSDEMPAEARNEELDEIDSSVVHVEESEVTSEEEHREAALAVVHVEQAKTTSKEEHHEDVIAISSHEKAKGALEGAHIEADAAGFHVEELETTSEEEQPEEGLLDAVSSNYGTPREEETATVEDDHDPYWRQSKGKKKIKSSIKSDVNQKGDCVDCGKRTYGQPHVCHNCYSKMASSNPWHGRRAGTHVDAKGAEKIQPEIKPVIPLVGNGTCVSCKAMVFARNGQLFDATVAERIANARARQNATEDDEDLMNLSTMNPAPANAPTGTRNQSSSGHYFPQPEDFIDLVSTFGACGEMLPPAAIGSVAMHQIYQGPDSGVGSPISDQDEDVVMSGTETSVEEQEMSGVERTALQQDVQMRKSLLFAVPANPRNRNDSSHCHQVVQEPSNARSLGQGQFFQSPAHGPGDRDGDIDMIDDTPSSSQAPARHGRGRPQAADHYGNITMPDASAARPQLPRWQNNRARGRRQDIYRQGNAMMSDTRTAPNRQALRMRDANVSSFRRPGPQQHYRPQRSLSTTPSTQHNLDREDYARRRVAAKAQRQAGSRGTDRPARRNAAPSRTDENDSVGLRIRGAAKERGEGMRDTQYAH